MDNIIADQFFAPRIPPWSLSSASGGGPGGSTQTWTSASGKATRTINIGARILDRNVAYSSYGIPIPITFGARLLPGNVIWCSPLDELSHTDKQKTWSGSPFPSLDLPGLGATPPEASTVETTTFYYFADFVVSLGLGDPTVANKVVGRIWANGKLIYDARDPNGNGADAQGNAFYGAARTPVSFFETLQFKLYPGTATQQPPEVIARYENAKYAEEHSLVTPINVVPGYRNQMLIAFEKFPITPFGNAIPFIKVELADVSSVTNVTATYTSFADTATWAATSYCTDWNNLVLYETDGATIRTIDLATQTLIRSVPVSRVKNNAQDLDTQGTTIGSMDISRYTGQLYATTNFPEPNQILAVNPVTGVCAPMGIFSGHIKMGAYIADWHFPDRIMVLSFVYMGQVADEVILSDGGAGTKLFSTEKGEEPFLIDHYSGGGLANQYTPGELGENTGIFYYYFTPAGGGVRAIYKCDSQGRQESFYVPVGNISFFRYYESMNALLVFEDTGATAVGKLIEVTTKEVIWTTASILGGMDNNEARRIWQDDYKSNQILILRGGAYTLLDLNTGVAIKEANLVYPAQPVTTGRFNAIFGTETYIFIDRVVVGRTTLGAFIKFAARLAGIDVDSGDPDLVVQPALDAISIDGSYIDQPNLSFRDLLDNLRAAFLFDIRESGHQIIIDKRTVGDVTDDFALSGNTLLQIQPEQSPALQISRSEDDGIPVRVGFNFLDFDREYEPGIVYAQRSGTSSSKTVLDMSIPIIMRMSEAKVWAYKVLYSFWNTRDSFQIRTSFGEIKTEPSDVGVILAPEDGRSLRVKIERVSYNTDWSMSITATNYVDESLITIPSDPPLGNYPQLQYYSPSSSYIFDIADAFPTDSDFIRDDRLAAITCIVGPDIPGRRWMGAQLVLKTIYGNGVGHNFMPEGVEGRLIARTLNTLATTNAPFEIDDVSALQVQASDGLTLSTISDALFFAGNTNVLAVATPTGHEIIRFRDVTDLGAGLYRLSHLLRGTRGTERFVNDHVGPAPAVFLIRGMQFKLPVDSKSRGTLLTATATTFNQGGNVSIVKATIEGNWQLPHQPWNVRAVRNTGTGTITISWTPRTRGPTVEGFVEDEQGEWDGPLWETVNKFELYFPDTNTFFVSPDFDAPGISIYDDKTDHRATNNPHTCTLTTAQQAAIFGSAVTVDQFDLSVYQHSGEWGRGVGTAKRVYIDEQ